MDAAPLDAIDLLELAELLDFTADALSWHAGSVVYPDLQAHLRRWVQRLGPDTPGWTWARPPTPPPPLDTATQAVLGSDVGSPDRPTNSVSDHRATISPASTNPSRRAVTMPSRCAAPSAKPRSCPSAARPTAATPAGLPPTDGAATPTTTRPSSSPRASRDDRSPSTSATTAASVPSATSTAKRVRISCAESASGDVVPPVMLPSRSRNSRTLEVIA